MAVITFFSAKYCNGPGIAREVASKLGYTFMDEEEVLLETSRRFPVSVEKLKRTLQGKPSIFAKFTLEKERNVAYMQAALANIVQTDKMVYIGFGSHLLPRDVPHILKVCILANRAFRIERASANQGISEKEALQVIKSEDLALIEWTRYLSDRGPWDQRLYDIKIPIHKTTEAEAVQLVMENADKPALKTTEMSRMALDDHVLATKINIALVKEGHNTHDLQVNCTDGNAVIKVNKYVIRLEHLQNELIKIAQAVPGVKSATSRVGPKFSQPDIYHKFNFELPSKVLLVDDEREFVQTLSERLQMREFGTSIVYNGEEALDVLEDDVPDVMILDLRMPGIDGFEVLRRVKKQHPHVKVIILTGHGSETDEKLAKELGAFAYLNKPVDIDVLAKTMKEAYQKLQEETSAED
ncbi:response regulator [candidate division CSSED10-310 bacterium]|uniref:Response regulator n=1 Tax=candidate division CSSED10-310 bacterium TaxID=2855610 RepID=A0ABV6Z2D6_UNCC1